ncbi:hypothetical protein ACOMHN_056577 [Nucella lapillus]
MVTCPPVSSVFTVRSAVSMLPEQGSGWEGLATAPMRTLVRRLPALGLLLLLLMMLTGLPASHAACPPEEEGVGVEELIHFSDVVVLGKVVGRFRHEGSSLYRVELKVFCVYKGHDVPLLIDIAEAVSWKGLSCT